MRQATATPWRHRARPHRHLFALVAVAAACSGDLAGEPDFALPAPDRDAFATEVQDILIQRCGNPTTCHGVETRPWAIYAPGANRIDPADLFYDFSLTEGETAANYDRTVPFTLDRGYGPELLSKPLVESESGVAHEGGDIFWSADDREYRVIEAWIAGGSSAPD